MNERIRDLKNKVLDDHFGFTWTSMDYQDNEKFAEKFAELILQQVMYLFGDEILSMHYLEQECCQDSITLLKSKIQEHFGVEE